MEFWSCFRANLLQIISFHFQDKIMKKGKNFQMLKRAHDRALCLKKNQTKLLRVEHDSCDYLARPCALPSLQNFNSFEGKHERAPSAVRDSCYKLLEIFSYWLVTRI
jgi:hypothetical protein